jgi:hypothetical protein
MVPSIDFRNVRQQNGRQDEGFEEICCQLALRSDMPPAHSQFIRFRGAGGDGGVECVWRQEDGAEWGYQAKYLFTLTQAKQQLHDSVSTAISIHPNLKKYVICLPFDLTGPTGRAQKSRGRPARSEFDVWENCVSAWGKLAKQRGMSVEFVLWSRTALVDRLLQIDPDHGRVRYWFDHHLFSDNWFANQLADAARAAEPRYTPALRVDVPIQHAFESLGRTAQWERTLSKLVADVRKSRSAGTARLPDRETQPFQRFRNLFFRVSRALHSS